MHRSTRITTILLALLLCLGSVHLPAAEQAASKKKAVTTKDLSIPVDELELLLEPMSTEELMVEADGWLAQVRKAVEDVTAAQLEIKRHAREEAAAAEAADGRPDSAAEATEDAAAADKAATEPETTDTATGDDEEKAEVLDEITELTNVRTERIDQLNAVLDQINSKIGLKDDGTEKDEVMPYRRYINAVSGLKVDVTDTQAVLSTLLGWMTSEEGGIRWASNIAVFLVTIVAFWILAGFVSKGVRKALSVAEGMSVLLSTFIVGMVRRIIMIVGIIVGLSALEVNIGPLLAVIGAAGFVVAFALQDTLSNFASGIMIMFYRPFDVDDVIDVSGVVGTVKSMNLVTTKIMTFDNKLMIVPNNSIWGNIITNATGSRKRRVDLVFGIGYQDDIAHAERVLNEIVAAHPLVLKDPEPVIQLHELADSSCNFVCRPWSKTEDFWTVYWDITRSVKERFDAEGISIPYPQRDVHLIQQQAPVAAAAGSGPQSSPATASQAARGQAGLDTDEAEDTA